MKDSFATMSDLPETEAEAHHILLTLILPSAGIEMLHVSVAAVPAFLTVRSYWKKVLPSDSQLLETDKE